MPKVPPAARTDACGVSDAKSTERLAGATNRLKSDPRNGNRSSRAWSGDQTKHGNRKYDIEMRYFHFVSHMYLQMYDGRARARTGHARSSHDTDKTQLGGRNTNMQYGNSAKIRYNHQMQR